MTEKKETILSEQQTQHFLIIMAQRDINPLLVISEIAGAVMAHYEPQVESLQRRVKELEEERDNWAKKANEWSAKSIDKINALESQLKSQQVGGWEEIAKKLLETYKWGALCEREGYYDPEEAMEAINQDAKALASQKGETK